MKEIKLVYNSDFDHMIWKAFGFSLSKNRYYYEVKFLAFLLSQNETKLIEIRKRGYFISGQL